MNVPEKLGLHSPGAIAIDINPLCLYCFGKLFLASSIEA